MKKIVLVSVVIGALAFLPVRAQTRVNEAPAVPEAIQLSVRYISKYICEDMLLGDQKHARKTVMREIKQAVTNIKKDSADISLLSEIADRIKYHQNDTARSLRYQEKLFFLDEIKSLPLEMQYNYAARPLLEEAEGLTNLFKEYIYAPSGYNEEHDKLVSSLRNNPASLAGHLKEMQAIYPHPLGSAEPYKDAYFINNYIAKESYVYKEALRISTAYTLKKTLQLFSGEKTPLPYFDMH
ncbi:hypothetical protein Dip518_000155 [Parelusimicrobium proximum]|uniref:hypothetical protein n=1 Tax=Parelusimicrobium proximum TaxID=3228953 RepID=UPI003D173D01